MQRYEELMSCGHIHRCSTDISTMNPIILVGIHNLEFHLRVNNFHAQISQWVQVGHPLRMNEINSVLWLYDVCILKCGMFTVVLWNSKSKIQTLKLESMWSGILRVKNFHMQISQWVQVDPTKLLGLKVNSVLHTLLHYGSFFRRNFAQLEAIFMLLLNETKIISNFLSFATFGKNIDDSFWTKCKNLWPPLPCLHVTDMSLHWLWMSPYHRFMSMCEWESEMEISTDFRHCLICLIHGMQNILQLRGHTQTHKLTHTLLTKNGPTNSCFSPDYFKIKCAIGLSWFFNHILHYDVSITMSHSVTNVEMVR